MKTLIVEDELTSLRILESILTDSCELEFATDASLAFDMFIEAHEAGECYELLCLDINMPNASGIDLLTEVRDFEESKGIVGSDCVKVFMITGDSHPSKVFDSMSKGATAYFTKPVDRAKLLEELQKITK